jgi:hypothetical protein
VRFALVFVCALAGCGGAAQKAPLYTTVTAIGVSTDAAYGVTVEVCDARERAIVARAGSSEADDARDLARVRAACDQLYMLFEAVRVGHSQALPAVELLEPKP